MNVKWYISDTSEKKVYSNKEIENHFENIGVFVSYHEEDIGDGKKRGVLTPFKKNIKTPPKESLVYGATGDIDGLTYFMERKGQDGVIKENYYEPRSEEEKNQIIERNRKRREQENAQIKTSSNSNKKDQPSEKEIKQQERTAEKEINFATNQQTSLQNNNNQNIYYGVGLISLVLLAVSIVVVWVKKR